MINQDYTPEAIAANDFAIPTRDYHKLYVKQSKFKHVLFALFIVGILIAVSIFLSS